MTALWAKFAWLHCGQRLQAKYYDVFVIETGAVQMSWTQHHWKHCSEQRVQDQDQVQTGSSGYSVLIRAVQGAVGH